MMTLARRGILTFVSFATALAVDVATKLLITDVVMRPPRDIEVTPFFNLTLGFNTGVSFGMFSDVFAGRPLLLAGLMMAIVAALLVWALRTDDRLETFGLGLIAGGATGNVLDRVMHGAVTDFLDFHLGGWHWPAFNMADVAICVGAGLLVWSAGRPAARVSAAHDPVRAER